MLPNIRINILGIRMEERSIEVESTKYVAMQQKYKVKNREMEGEGGKSL